MNIDTHFYIFEKKSSNGKNSRYSINYDARLENWRKAASPQGITGGVLVQPSFLGFDNALILQTIQDNATSLKGVACLPPTTAYDELISMKSQGIMGVRLNLYGTNNPIAILNTNKALIEQLCKLGMHLQIHHDDGLLNKLLQEIPQEVNIVIDHFGRPSSNEEFLKDSSGIDKHRGSLWVKLSGQYRIPKIDHQKIFDYWREKIGGDRLLWGSDWPHTQFEDKQDFNSQIKNLHTFTNDAFLREKILSSNPLSLYWS